MDRDHCLSPAIGSSGGLISVWRKPFFQMMNSRIERNWIGLEGTISLENFQCILINVYNPCNLDLRARVWQEIKEFCKTVNKPCLITGDFNETLDENDRGSRTIDAGGSTDFKSFISDLDLIEIHTEDGWYTWFRGASKSKLDKTFVQAEWFVKYPTLKTSLLKRSISDHCPLLTHTHDMDWGPKPFRFQNIWLTHKGCMEVVRKTWGQSNNTDIMMRLKKVKEELKIWNKKDFGNIEDKISSLECEIHRWDHIANSRDLSEVELKERAAAQWELWDWLKKKETYWAQNSRIQWLKLGDRNSKFFHLCASIRRSRNNISSLHIRGSKISDLATIKKEAVDFYKNLFNEEPSPRPFFTELDFKKLSSLQSESLIAPFSHLEIDSAMASCNPSKAPGPDGFNFAFIKAAWEHIKEDVYLVVNEFWRSGKLPKGSNVAFITLIAKTVNPKGFQDFRPISMVGSIYKIIAKLLSLRLKQVMGDLVGVNQSSFIEGRQILDGELIAGELFDSCKRNNTKAVFLKLDFHKAFDCVSWEFLDWTLKQMGFPTLWCKWISGCISSAAASILINGSPSDPFKLKRGLRQGDPLSPFLFVLAVEVLNLMIKKASELQLWSGLEVGNHGTKLTHLQYVDDTIIFSPQNLKFLQNIKKPSFFFNSHLALK